MKLTFEQIKSAASGAVRAEEKDGIIRLLRFTKEQEEIYKVANEDFYNKTFSTSGIKLVFKTDSRSLFIKINTVACASRKYFSLDVFADGEPIGNIDNFSGVSLPQNYIKVDLPVGEFSETFELGEGEKNVTVYLPWSVGTDIIDISIEDGASFEPIRASKKMLVFGDSITHGNDALHPSMRYSAKLAERLDAEEVCKAIGGEVFFPALAKSRDDFDPDYITVAYGSNDWSWMDKESFEANCRAFYGALSEHYPKAEIFAITPIWRKDLMAEKKLGLFTDVEKMIAEYVRDLHNVTVISGFDFVPKDESYYADLRLHPNDEGFEHYYQNLYREIKQFI